MHKLYKITNKCNNKTYIGITKLELSQRFGKHIADSENPKYPLHYAIAKYGTSNFIIELLYESIDRKTISDLEDPIIHFTNSHISENGYNVARGGYGGDLGEEANKRRKETLAKRSSAELARLADLQRKRQIGRTKYNNAGRMSQSQKVLGNQFRKGIPHTDATKKKISDTHTGKIVPIETRQKMSKSAIINQNGTRFAGRRATCLCCKREFDIGNYTLHIRKNSNEF